MISVDTNILARAILQDNKKEYEIASKLLTKLSSERKLFISSTAILELIWVLKVNKISRKEIVNAIQTLLNSEGTVVSNKEIINLALELYEKGKQDFGDYFIIAESEIYNVKKVASFDKDLCRELSFCKQPNHYL